MTIIKPDEHKPSDDTVLPCRDNEYLTCADCPYGSNGQGCQFGKEVEQ